MLHESRVIRVLLTAFGFLASASAHAALPVTLSVDTLFPLSGGVSVFTVTGPPGAQFEVWRSPNPAETVIAGEGMWFLDTANQARIENGVIPQGGVKTFTEPVPSDPNLIHSLWYFQAKAQLAPDKGLSPRSITQRIVSSPPAGARKPEALAVTPDGSRAFVANEADGTVQVLDAGSDTLLEEIPVAPPPPARGPAIEAAIDPDGRHLFVINPQMARIAVLHAATGSVSAQLPVPKSCRDVAFRFIRASSARPKIFVTNDRDDTVLVFTENPPGTFTQTDTLALQGKGPGAIAVLPNGLLMVGHRATHELEVVNPAVPGGATVARTALAGAPADIVIAGGRALVSTFVVPNQAGVGDGDNVVLAVDLSTFQVVVSDGLANQGTDYWDAATNGTLLAVVATGSGTVTMADAATLALLERIDLVPGGPTGNPYQAAFVPPVAPTKLYVVDHFRETVRPVDLTSGPPFGLLSEIALARSGLPRVPLVDLTPLENGEWFFSSVEFFNGTANNPNRTTCNTCHPHTFASGLKHPNTPTGRNAQSMFDVGNTGPWLWKGNAPDLMAKTQGLFTAHGTVGGVLNPETAQLVFDFQMGGTKVPVSPFLDADGNPSPPAENGKLIFEGKANCSSCHAAPLFIPEPPNPPNIPQGVGVGLAPDNVTSLRGLWSSAPYLWNGSAATIRDVIVNNPDDKHGTTSALTEQEIDDLVEFLKTL
jgi:DNA-binding beta-propeller fold protein YncE